MAINANSKCSLIQFKLAKALINSVDLEGKTILHYIAINNNNKLLRLLKQFVDHFENNLSGFLSFQRY